MTLTNFLTKSEPVVAFNKSVTKYLLTSDNPFWYVVKNIISAIGLARFYIILLYPRLYIPENLSLYDKLNPN